MPGAAVPFGPKMEKKSTELRSSYAQLDMKVKQSDNVLKTKYSEYDPAPQTVLSLLMLLQ